MQFKKSRKPVAMVECSACQTQIEARHAFKLATTKAVFCYSCYLLHDHQGKFRDPRAADRDILHVPRR